MKDGYVRSLPVKGLLCFASSPVCNAERMAFVLLIIKTVENKLVLLKTDLHRVGPEKTNAFMVVHVDNNIDSTNIENDMNNDNVDKFLASVRV